MKQHAVPEEIMDVEFKLFGSLTAKQFGYIIAGGIMGLVLFYVFKGLGSSLLGIVFAILSGLLGVSLALIRINEQPFEVWLGNFLAAMFTSQKRVWKKDKKVPESLSTGKPNQAAQQTQQIASVPQSQQLPPQQPVTPSIQQPQQNQQSQAPALPQHPFKQLGQMEDSDSQLGDAPEQEQGAVAGQQSGGDVHYVPGSAQGSISMMQNQSQRPVTIMDNQQNTQQSNTQEPPPQDRSGVSDVVLQQGRESNSQSVQPQQQQQAPVPVDNTSQGQPQGQIPQPVTSFQKQVPVDTSPAVSTTPQSQGGLDDIVPDRQKVLQQSMQDSSQISPGSQPDEGNRDDELEDENKALRQRVAEYSETNQKLTSELKESKQGYEELKVQNQEILKQLEQLGSELSNLKQAPQPEPKLPSIPSQQLTPQPQSGQGDSGDDGLFKPRVYSGPSLTKKSNVVSGIVKTKEGKLLPGVVVIVKDPSKPQPRPIRAMKTNSLGQFITTSAIEENGTYIIELSKSGYSFGRYEIELTGEMLPTYEFIAS